MWAIDDFLKTGAQFVYVRRYKRELKNNNKFFADISDRYPEVKFEIKGSTYLINDKPAGYAIPLATAITQKSTPYPDVNKIIFDEFIIDKGAYHYLPNEVVSFLELYDTIARTRDVRVFFLSNAITVTNPYFLYFDLRLPNNKNFRRYDDILLELVQDADYIKMKSETRFGKLIAGTKYADYNINNKFLRDDDSFVGKKTEKATYYFTIKYHDSYYGIWIDYSVGKIFVSENIDPCCKLIYVITLSDHTPNTLLLKQLSKAVLFKNFIEQYKIGNVWFESIKLKNIIYEVIRMTMNGR